MGIFGSGSDDQTTNMGMEMSLRSVLRGIIDQQTGTRIKFRTTGLIRIINGMVFMLILMVIR